MSYYQPSVETGSTLERRYQVVIFDTRGTLVGFADDAPFERFLGMVKVPHRFKSGTDLRLNVLRTLTARHDDTIGLAQDNVGINYWWRIIFETLFPESPVVASYMWELFERNFFDSLFPDTLPILRRLAAHGVPMGIISNFGTNLLNLLFKFDIAGYFDFAIISANEGVAKPDPRIFEIGLAAAGIPANQALYVGDSITEDIEGARKVGMDAILIRRPGQQSGTAPMMINSLLEVEKLVFPQLGANLIPGRPYWSNDSSLPIPPLLSPQYSATT